MCSTVKSVQAQPSPGQVFSLIKPPPSPVLNDTLLASLFMSIGGGPWLGKITVSRGVLLEPHLTTLLIFWVLQEIPFGKIGNLLHLGFSGITVGLE